MLLNIEMRVKCTTIVENSSISIFKTVKSSWGGGCMFSGWIVTVTGTVLSLSAALCILCIHLLLLSRTKHYKYAWKFSLYVKVTCLNKLIHVTEICHSAKNLEKKMATHSCILAWRIPWTEETGGLLSIGSQRVGRNWSDLACMHALEKEMATHSSILAWRIPGTEDPGELMSMGRTKSDTNKLT